MDRRAFIGTVTAAILGAPLVGEAQQPAKAWRVAMVLESPIVVAQYRQSLRELG